VTNDRYRRNAGSVYSLKYHLVWCPKYRRPVLVGGIAEDLKALPDHVQFFVASDPTVPVQFLVNQFKEYTSRVLRQRYPSLVSRLPTLWSRSYYAGTVGHVSAETVRRYIEAQMGK
jgi:REP-associated tyrosine transposase